MITKYKKSEFESYLTDASNLKGNADLLFIPESKNELIDCIKYCYDNKIPITVSGAGTGTTGGRVAKSGAIISTELLNKILDFNVLDGSIVVESGVTLKDLYDFLYADNLFYPPNPTEINSSIGGNIANNSSGSRSFKYGSSKNFVLELDVILSNGDELKLIRKIYREKNNIYSIQSENGNIYKFEIPSIYLPKTKNSTGYFLQNDMELIDLFIGSEGTLGVIYSAKLKLLPKPKNVYSSMIFFENDDNMLDFVDVARELSRKSFVNSTKDNLSFRLIEYFDENSLRIINEKNRIFDSKANCAIWVEQEYDLEFDDEILLNLQNLIEKNTNLSEYTIFALTEKEHQKLYDIRHSIPLWVNDTISKTKFRKIGTDTAVPLDNFRNYFKFLKEQADKSNVQTIIFGHIGDCHLHCNFFPTNEEDMRNVKKIYEEIINETIRQKGSISAEHGIGKIKVDYFEQMYGFDALKKFKMIKKNFDNKLLLGLGNLFNI